MTLGCLHCGNFPRGPESRRNWALLVSGAQKDSGWGEGAGSPGTAGVEATRMDDTEAVRKLDLKENKKQQNLRPTARDG